MQEEKEHDYSLDVDDVETEEVHPLTKEEQEIADAYQEDEEDES